MDVGGAWYFYSQPIEGPPDYGPDNTVADQATVERAPPPQASDHAFYYRSGDIKGVPYDTVEECWQAMQQDGSVGVCMMKLTPVLLVKVTVKVDAITSGLIGHLWRNFGL